MWRHGPDQTTLYLGLLSSLPAAFWPPNIWIGSVPFHICITVHHKRPELFLTIISSSAMVAKPTL